MVKRMFVLLTALAMLFCPLVNAEPVQSSDKPAVVADFNYVAADVGNVGNGNGREGGSFHERVWATTPELPKSEPSKPPTPEPPTPEQINRPSETYSADDEWLIYWYACGTDIETKRIYFGKGTNLETNQIVIGDEKCPGDVTRCIREIEAADFAPNVKVLVQAGGTYIWGHEAFRANNASLQVQDYEKYSLWTLGALNNYKRIRNGQIGRYLYVGDKKWIPREQIPISGAKDTETDMGSLKGLISFLEYGKRLEQELYPGKKVHRVFIFRDHGGGSLHGICWDEYTGSNISLENMREAFNAVWGNSTENPPFEIVAFDACLMSTYETAVSLEGAAHYMIASQNPTIGKVSFDYTGFINALSKNPAMNGAQLSQVICDTYREDSKRTDEEFKDRNMHTEDLLTMSVTDLSKIDEVRKAYDNFAQAALECAEARSAKGSSILAPLSTAALKAENYNNNIERREYCNMTDLKDFAAQIKKTRVLSEYPKLVKASDDLIKAIDDAVIYNEVRSKSFKKGGGLSTVYPYELREDAVDRYRSLAENNLASEKQKELYDKMVEDSKRTDLFDLSDMGETVEIDIDKDKKSFSVKLSEKQTDRIADVNFTVGRVVAFEIEGTLCWAFMYLGTDPNVKENWQAGKFESLLSTKWLSLNGHLVYVRVVSDSVEKDNHGKKISGSELYAVPIKLKSGEKIEELNLMIARDYSEEYPEGNFRILGARQGIYEQIPSDELRGIKEGDEITLRYPMLAMSFDTLTSYIEAVLKRKGLLEKYGDLKTLTKEQQEELQKSFTADEIAEMLHAMEMILKSSIKIEIRDGSSFTVGDEGIQPYYRALPDGNYFYNFEFVNPTSGESGRAATFPVFIVKDEKITDIKESMMEVEVEKVSK